MFFFLAAAFVLAATGCVKEASNEITIRIISPVEDQVVANAASVLIHVEFEATDENHNVELFIHKDGDVNDVAFEWDQHDHDKKIVLMETIDLSSYPSVPSSIWKRSPARITIVRTKCSKMSSSLFPEQAI
jgi:hypothetical protein